MACDHFFFLRKLSLKVRQDAAQYLANSFHGASVSPVVVITSHHNGERKCPSSHRKPERVSCLL